MPYLLAKYVFPLMEHPGWIGLKEHELKAKLSTLLSDDAFLDALVAEYLAQAATLKPKPAATAPAPAPAPAAAASPDVPPHLLALLQQQVGP